MPMKASPTVAPSKSIPLKDEQIWVAEDQFHFIYPVSLIASSVGKTVFNRKRPVAGPGPNVGF